MSMHTVSKNQFIQVLQNYLSTSPEDAREIQALADEFPYSQVLHALWARLSKDHQLAEHQAALQMAAVYACDRTVLKKIMTRTMPAWPVSHEQEGLSHPDTPESISSYDRHGAPESEMADKVIHDLARLSAARHHFESLFEKGSGQAAEGSAAEHNPDEAGHDSEDGAKKSKKQRIIELVKALEEEDDPHPSNGNDNSEEIIREMKSSKKKIAEENDKQREQAEIIDQFIKAQPSISSISKEGQTVTERDDLTEIKTVDFSDHIISETLVEILLNQGKKERAIEVLKKLIWKFPQKKAYFAAQIEDLRK